MSNLIRSITLTATDNTVFIAVMQPHFEGDTVRIEAVTRAEVARFIAELLPLLKSEHKAAKAMNEGREKEREYELPELEEQPPKRERVEEPEPMQRASKPRQRERSDEL